MTVMMKTSVARLPACSPRSRAQVSAMTERWSSRSRMRFPWSRSCVSIASSSRWLSASSNASMRESREGPVVPSFTRFPCHVVNPLGQGRGIALVDPPAAHAVKYHDFLAGQNWRGRCRGCPFRTERRAPQERQHQENGENRHRRSCRRAPATLPRSGERQEEWTPTPAHHFPVTALTSAFTVSDLPSATAPLFCPKCAARAWAQR